MTREEFLKNQDDYCNEKNEPFFMPKNGYCYSCRRDIVQPLIDRGKTGKDELITGCPLCHRSYCD